MIACQRAELVEVRLVAAQRRNGDQCQPGTLAEIT